MGSAVAAASRASTTDRPIRVMVVDDAVVIRSLLTRWIEAEADMKVTASLRSGNEAVAELDRHEADVVLLDVDMPDLDGIAALPLLLQKKSDLVVIMVSTLTRRSAETSLRALSCGAADYIPKPHSAYDTTVQASFRRELIEKVRTLGRNRALSPSLVPGQAPVRLPSARSAYAPTQPHDIATAVPRREIVLRPFSPIPPCALLVGSSTGGPQALASLVGQLAVEKLRAPVLITQHMPPMFTTVLAEHLSRLTTATLREAEHNEPVLPGHVYVAPGGRHMRVKGDGAEARIELGDDAAIHFCRPAVDAMFTSAASVWGAGCLAVVLTGMGSDGLQGAGKIVAAGGSVIAQDEASSVVWGMPRVVAQAGLCAAVLPLERIAPRITQLFSGGRS